MRVSMMNRDAYYFDQIKDLLITFARDFRMQEIPFAVSDQLSAVVIAGLKNIAPPWVGPSMIGDLTYPYLDVTSLDEEGERYKEQLFRAILTVIQWYPKPPGWTLSYVKLVKREIWTSIKYEFKSTPFEYPKPIRSLDDSHEAVQSSEVSSSVPEDESDESYTSCTNTGTCDSCGQASTEESSDSDSDS